MSATRSDGQPSPTAHCIDAGAEERLELLRFLNFVLTSRSATVPTLVTPHMDVPLLTSTR